MIDKYDPFAPHMPEGMTPEEIAEEEERLKRLQFEDDLFQERQGIERRTAKISRLEE